MAETIEATFSRYPMPAYIGIAIAPAITKVMRDETRFGVSELSRLEINKPGAKAIAEIMRIEISSLRMVKVPIRLPKRCRARSELDKYPIPNETAIPTVIRRIGRTK